MQDTPTNQNTNQTVEPTVTDVDWVRNQIEGGRTPDSIRAQMANPPAGREQEHAKTLKALDLYENSEYFNPAPEQSLSEQKQSRLDDTFKRRAKEAADTQFRKKLQLDRRATIENHRIDTSSIDKREYLLNGDPELSFEERQYVYARSERMKTQEQKAEIARMEDTERSVGEIAGDTGISLVKGAVNTVGGFYGLANQISKGLDATVGTAGRTVASLIEDGSIYDEEGNVEAGLFDAQGMDSAFSIGSRFVETSELLSEQQSEGLQARRDKVNTRVAASREKRIQKLRNRGLNPDDISNQIKTEAGDFGATVVEYWNNPTLIADGVLESIPEFLSGGLVKKSADNLLSGLAKLQGKKEAGQMSDTAAGTLNIVATEAGNVANQAGARIMEMDDAAIMNSKAAESLLEQNPDYTADEIKRILADEAATKAFAISAPIAATAGLVTGAAKLQGGALDALTGQSGNVLRGSTRAVGGTVSEGAEETIQGVGGGIAENVAVGESLEKEDYNPVEGTGQQAGAGLMVGSALGGTIGSAAAIAESIKTGKELSTKVGDNKREIDQINRGDFEGPLAKAVDDNLPDKAVRILATNATVRKSKEAGEEAAKNHLQALVKQNNNAIDLASQLDQERIKAEEAGDTKGAKKLQKRVRDLTAAAKVFSERKSIIARYLLNEDPEVQNQARDTLSKLDSQDADVLSSLTEDEINNAVEYFGSDPDSISINAIEKIESISDRLTPVQKNRVQSVKQVKQAEQNLAQVSGKKSINEVNTDVLTGRTGRFIGLKTHQETLNTALKTDDTDTAEQAVTNMRNFTEQRVKKANLARRIFDGIQNNSPEVETLQKQFNEEFSYGSRNQGGAFINAKSGRLVNQLEAEADLAKAYFNNAKSSYEAKFNTELSEPDYSINIPSQSSLEVPSEPEVTETVDEPVQEETPDVASVSESEQVTEAEPVQEDTKPEPKQALKERAGEYIGKKFGDTVFQRGTKLKAKEYGKFRTNLENTIATVIDRAGDDVTAKDTKEAIDTVYAGFIDRTEDNVDESRTDSLYKYGVRQAEATGASFSFQERLFRASRNLKNLFRIKPGPKSRITGRMNPIDSLVDGREFNQLTDDQQELFTTLRDFRNQFAEAMNKENVAGKYGSKIKDSALNPITWLQTRTKKQSNNPTPSGLETNVLDAFAVVGMQVVDETFSIPVNYNNDIEGIVGNENLTAQQINNFRHIGVPKATVTESIGQQVIDLLGLQTKDYVDEPVFDEDGNDTGETNRVYSSPIETDRMVVAIGNFALAVMSEMGLVEITDYPNAAIEKAKSPLNTARLDDLVLAHFRENSKNRKAADFQTVTYVRPRLEEREGRTEQDLPLLTKRVAEVFTNAGSETLNDKFGTDKAAKEPSFAPVKITQKNYKKTVQELPARVKKALQKHSDRPIEVKEGMAPLLSTLHALATDNTLLPENTRNQLQATMFGFYDLDARPRELLDNDKARNEASLRDLDSNITWMNKAADKPFFVPHEMWRNGRIGIASNVANMQNSKLARHMFSYSDQRVDLDPRDLNSKEMIGFQLALAQHLGIDIDKQTLDVSLEQLTQKRNHPDVINALAALDSLVTDENTKENIELLNKGIRAAGNSNLASLEGLVNLKRFEDALENNTNFTTDIGLEVDGINNGVAISLLQFGGFSVQDTVDMLEATGVYSDGKVIDFSDWKEVKGNLDVYERFAKTWGTILKEQPNLGSLDIIMGPMLTSENEVTKLGRNLSKPLVMLNNYLAGGDSQIENFTDVIYEKVMVTLADPEKSTLPVRREFFKLFRNIGTPLNDSQIELLKNKPNELVMTPEQRSAFNSYVTENYKDSIEQALTEEFGPMRERMGKFVKAYGIAFETWFAFYEKAEEAKLKELGIFGKLPQEVELELYQSTLRYAPVLPSYFSDGDVKEALAMYKTERDRLDTKETKVEIKMSGKLSNAFVKIPNDQITAVGVRNKQTFTDQPSYRKFKKPGASPGAKGVQSLDGTTMLLLLEKMGALNIHDAFMFPVDRALDSATTGNEVFMEAMTNYSLPAQAAELLNNTERLIRNARTRLDPKLSNADVIAKRLGIEPNNKQTAEARLEQSIRETAADLLRYDYDRKEVLGRISSVSQYHVPGGNLLMNQADTQATGVNLDTLGSDGSKFSDFKPVENATVDSTNSFMLFESFNRLDEANLSDEHKAQLGKVLSGVVNEVLQPVKVRMENISPEAVGRFAAGNNTVDLKITRPGYNLADKTNTEVYVHEMVHVVTHLGLKENPRGRGELEKVFTALRKAGLEEHPDNPEYLFLQDPANSTDQQIRAAKRVWDYVMDDTTGNYLDEFIAHGLTNEYMITGLKKEATNKQLKKVRRSFNVKADTGSPFTLIVSGAFDTLLNVLSDIINFFTDRYFNVQGLKADARVFALARHIADTENNQTSKFWAMVEKAEGVNGVQNEQVRNYIIEPALKLMQKSGISGIKNVGTIAGSILTDRVTPEGWSRSFSDMRKRMSDSKDNLVRSLMREFEGQNQSNKGLYKLMRMSNKFIDQTRKKVATAVKQLLRQNTFATQVTREESEAITRAAFKTDLSSLLIDDALLRDMTKEQLEEYISNPANAQKFKENMELIRDLLGSVDVRNREKDRLITEIKQRYRKNGDYYVAQTLSLGTRMATGNAQIEDTMRNAHAIANLAGRKAMTIEGNVDFAERLIDQLATVESINKTDALDVQRLYSLLVRESKAQGNSIDKNGLVTTLQMYAQFKKDSLDTLFNGNPMLMEKGYIKEVTNPNIALAYATNPEEAEALLQEGYSEVGFLDKDVSDWTRGRVKMFINKAGGMNTYSKSILSFTSMKKRGHSLYDGHVLSGTDNASLHSIQDVFRIVAINEHKYKRGNIGQDDGVILEPVLNEQGDIVDYRYTMSDQNKRELLGRNDDFAEVLGGMYGNIVDKQNSEMINNTTIDYLKQMHDQADIDDSEWIEISATTMDEDAREIWSMLPNSSKEHAKEVFGRPEILIRKDDFRLLVGFRKWSITDLDTKKLMDSNNEFLKLIGKHLTKVINRPGVRITENVIQELVRMAKDTIVVKSGAVLVANTISNAIVLKMEGVPTSKLIRYQAEGWKYAAEYKNNEQELNMLQVELSSDRRMSNTERRRKEARVTQLNKALELNPAKDLIDEGIFQTIVEDIEVEDEKFTYKSQLEEWATPVTERIPQGLKDIGNTMFMTHDTKMYRALLDATQLSDFVARYALHKHQMEQVDENGEARFTHDESVSRVIDSFVDYDAPTHVAIQYLNDMGLLMFTKFFIRIQKVILRQIRENPGNVLSFVMLQQFLGINAPDIFETSVLDPDNLDNRLYTPFGALEDTMNLHLFNVRL